MEYVQGSIRLSATDVANHLSCKHLTVLNLLFAKGGIAAPDWANPDLKVLQQLGLEHEKAYVQSLRDKGVSIEEIPQGPNARNATIAAMKKGVHAIVQADLASGEWLGRADVLLRVGKPSGLGEWSYEAVDCKLSRTTKAETILQLCFYSGLLSEVQELEPELFHVVRPHVEYEPESYRVSQFSAYYRYVKHALKQAVGNGAANTYPEVVPHCDVCRWWKHCDQERRKDDSLSFVHGASRLQRKELAVHHVTTLKALAELPLPIPFKPSKGGLEGYARIREQARIQLETRTSNEAKWELLKVQPRKGLWKLPNPCPGDVFFDLEGDPFTGDGGLEYLFGLVNATDDGKLVYHKQWALDRACEKTAFEWFINFVIGLLAKFPDLHIYHFGTYEPSAIKRLVLRYATKEEEVDRLLRGKVFVDLHQIFKESVLAGVEQYSLKELEQYYGYVRLVPLSDAKVSLRTIQHLLQLSLSANVTDPTMTVVASYNEDDCRSAKSLQMWLEDVRSAAIASGDDIERPVPEDGTPSEKSTAHHERVAAMFDALTHDLPMDPDARDGKQAAMWLLAHSLDWHGREKKVQWWEFFRLAEMEEDELYDERTAIAGMKFTKRLPRSGPREKVSTDEYAYPPQECSIKAGDGLYTQDKEEFGEVKSIDSATRTITIKKKLKTDALHPSCVFSHSRFSTVEQSESILRIAESVVKNGIEYSGDYRAARDLLLRNPPRFDNESQAIPQNPVVESIVQAGLSLDNSIFPIQGPPGAGKTFTAAHMICSFVTKGRRVGITAVSHKVIRKLLDDVIAICFKSHIAGVKCGHLNKKYLSDTDGALALFRDEGKAVQSLQTSTINVLGGTAFLWSKEALVKAVDVLFIDEAGQMSLANALSCAPSASNLVLLGDPQQLEQPTQGSHPEGSDVSVLAHILGSKKTIEATQGVFLEQTRRLHPDLCKFTSEMFYESRLISHPGLENQRIDAGAPFEGAGLWVVPVKHSGNQSHSQEEIDAIASLVEHLTTSGKTWTDANGQQHPLSLDKILIVAPFNDQVSRLSQRLPAAHIGTVDRFQGQEGTIVIYSMTASSAEDAPRGMEFLYDLNRFNVATSRARCACIVVASPRLFEPDCRTPRQIELANALCRYVELGKSL